MSGRKTVLSVTKWTPCDFATNMNLLQRERCKEEKGTLDHIKLQKYSLEVQRQLITESHHVEFSTLALCLVKTAILTVLSLSGTCEISLLSSFGDKISPFT